jgi:hypothetical protein
MPFSTRVVGFAVTTGEALLSCEPPWWNARRLARDPRFQESNDTGSYRDYDADLSIEEMRELHEKFRPITNSGIFGQNAWQEKIEPMIRQLYEALYLKPDRYSHFHIHLYEWET